MKLEGPKNPNYCATVVVLDKFVDLQGCDNIKGALIFGNQVIVGKDSKAGDVGLFFPVETKLSDKFLSSNDLYRHSEKNEDNTKKGYFEDHGRIRAVKFRGHKSEGFFCPLVFLSYLNVENPNAVWILGSSFDSIDGNEICCKYVPKRNPASERKLQGRVARLEDRIVDQQFRFHYDTENLRRNINKLNPNDWISVSDKWHGTSVVIANILVNRQIKWYEKLALKLGLKIQTQEYSIVWSSRRVVKGIDDTPREGVNHFYDGDVWGDMAGMYGPNIPEGFTIYGEIVGWDGEKEIQNGYSYGVIKGNKELRVYRVTFTNPQGKVFELQWNQMYDFCQKYGLLPVLTYWYGKASDFYPYNEQTVTLEGWQNIFLEKLEMKYVNDSMCPYNDNKVPAEGIVLRIDRLNGSEAYKCKNYSFLERETKLLDKGTVDIETEQSEVETNVEDSK